MYEHVRARVYSTEAKRERPRSETGASERSAVSSVTCRRRLPFRHRPSHPTGSHLPRPRRPPLIITTIELDSSGGRSPSWHVDRGWTSARRGQEETGRRSGVGSRVWVTRRPCHVRFQPQPSSSTGPPRVSTSSRDVGSFSGSGASRTFVNSKI